MSNQSIKEAANQETDYDCQVPERNLLAAMLHKAITDFLDPKGEDGRKWERRAYRWLMSGSSREFKFYWICLMLDLKPLIIRDMIMQHKAQGIVWHDGVALRVRYTLKGVRERRHKC